MPWIVLVVLVVNIIRALRKQGATRVRPVCAGCAFVHMQYGTTGRNAIFCTYSGGLRPVRIDVLYCTDYRKRGEVPVRKPIGFVLIQGNEPAA